MDHPSGSKTRRWAWVVLIDSNLIAALIGGGATVVAAIITVVFVNRARHPQPPAAPPDQEAEYVPAPRREPWVITQTLGAWLRRLWDDPVGTITESAAKLMAVVITVAVLLLIFGSIAYGLWQAVRGAFQW